LKDLKGWIGYRFQGLAVEPWLRMIMERRWATLCHANPEALAAGFPWLSVMPYSDAPWDEMAHVGPLPENYLELARQLTKGQIDQELEGLRAAMRELEMQPHIPETPEEIH